MVHFAKQGDEIRVESEVGRQSHFFYSRNSEPRGFLAEEMRDI